MILKGDINFLNHLHLFAIVGVALVIIVSSIIPFAKADSMNPSMYSTDSKPFGQPYKDWIVKFWQWLYSIPQKENPNLDNTGAKCAINQNDPHVWFLVPTFGGSAERTCTIPAGKAILFPILSGDCDYSANPKVKTESDLLRCASQGNEGGVMEATVDGVKLQNLDKYRVQTSLFDLSVPKDNAFGEPTAKTQAIADGFYVFLQPLSPGKHDIHFSGNVVDNPTTGTQSYSTDVTYHLIIH